MQPSLEWSDILFRLALTVVAGTLVGLNREGHGRAAGLRTNLLVCLAAALSMIQANLLLTTAGKAEGSFVSIDVMRLPLGVLTGMGFIGGGAILRKGDVVMGVTTAATLWFVTIVGLCFGGGQTALGIVALVLGMLVLSGLKRAENHLTQVWRGLLTLTSTIDGGSTEGSVRAMIAARGFTLISTGVSYDKPAGRWTFRCDLRWHADHPEEIQTLLKSLSDNPGILELSWTPQDLA